MPIMLDDILPKFNVMRKCLPKKPEDLEPTEQEIKENCKCNSMNAPCCWCEIGWKQTVAERGM